MNTGSAVIDFLCAVDNISSNGQKLMLVKMISRGGTQTRTAGMTGTYNDTCTIRQSFSFSHVDHAVSFFRCDFLI